LGLVLVGIAFVFGPLRQATVGFRVFIGVLFGISFKLISDILGPLSIVFEMPPMLAILAPIIDLFCHWLILLAQSRMSRSFLARLLVAFLEPLPVCCLSRHAGRFFVMELSRLNILSPINPMKNRQRYCV
jgi:hypothetical protein